MLGRGFGEVLRCGVPGLLLGLVLMGGFGNIRGPAAQAQAEVPVRGEAAKAAAPYSDGSGTLAFTAPTAGSAQLLYLIDTRTRAFTVYRIDPTNAEGTVKLVGARQYSWDLRLSHYSNQQPDVPSVESIVRTLGRQTPSR